MRRCSEIFAGLFEEPKGGRDAQRKALRRKASILDDNLAEVRQLEQRMGTADKGRLDQYLTSVREAEIRTRRADAWLDTPLPVIQKLIANGRIVTSLRRWQVTISELSTT
jgi:hypothetical protein